MRIPRIAVLVPLLLAGILLPAARAAPRNPAPEILGMAHEAFSQNRVTVNCGQTLTLQNSSRFVHIIGPGEDGLLSADKGNPVTRRVLTETDDVFTTAAWNTPGVHHLTCSVHPEMNVTVVVRNCSARASG